MTKFSADWSRRTFLRGALATGALVLPGTGLLAGCATSGGDGDGATEGTVSDENPLGVPTDQPLEIYIFNGGFGDALRIAMSWGGNDCLWAGCCRLALDDRGFTA